MLATLISLLTPLEMLLINLFVIDSCSEKRYSRRFTYAMMGLFMVVLMTVSYFISSRLPGFGSGNGLFVFSGFLFLIPVKYLYKNSIAKIICLACTSWVYTFFVFSLSIHISYMIERIPQNSSTLILQTVLYLATFFPFYRLLKTKFLNMLSQLSDKETMTLMWMSIVWFWTAFIINLVFIYPEIYVFRILAIVSTAICALNFYRYIYRVINSGREIETLEQIAYRDNLTQSRSRVVLTNDGNEYIERGLPFDLIFMDLNRFKQINDTFGHAVGDEYLAYFAQQVKSRLGSNGGFYRISGDEFVCLYSGDDINAFISSLGSLPRSLPKKSEVRFLGVSYGISSFPDDGDTLDELLNIADQRMYMMKNSHKVQAET